jgi:hypothetical protein
VTFLPGRARVAAQPSATGSVPPMATTGVEVVAFVAAALGISTEGYTRDGVHAARARTCTGRHNRGHSIT